MKEDNSKSVYMVKYRTYSAWFFNGVLHREDGPAIEYESGTKEWFSNGVRHRKDGPAVERTGGYKYWWFYGKHLSKKEWFESLSEDLKIKALFNESFVLG